MIKINDKEVKNNGYFAYDGCHKIYILEDNDDLENAKEIGYNILPIEEIENIYNNSCDLRFIHNWKLNITYVYQFEDFKIEKGVENE